MCHLENKYVLPTCYIFSCTVFPYLVSLQVLQLCETPPTIGTLEGILGRVSVNVKLKVSLAFKFFTAKGARKSDRIFAMFSFHMFRKIALV